jgi:hypothetical protein
MHEQMAKQAEIKVALRRENMLMLFLIADYLAGVTISALTATAMRGKPDLNRDTVVISQKAGSGFDGKRICVSMMSKMIVNREGC